MAIRFSLCSSSILPLSHASNKGPRKSKLVMCANNGITVNLQIRACDPKNKVFEDRSAGIVCYKDENGEIICEGYDEGPRFHHRISRCTCNSRDVEIIDLLQRCWVHVADENEFNSSDKGQRGSSAQGF
ncbi:hypothetical protein DH2020_047539 [Rehmannia glutinosa]|uniref:Uncharacterized protein n=1 Tax=Rehmannia glutinosa TaxID=99300 RepID=A0ABR0U896_REHGL